MKRIFGYAALFTLAASFAPGISGAFMGPSSASPAMAAGQAPVFEDLAKAGKKCWIGEDFYFTYGFDKTPKMGIAILKIELFDKAGKRVTDVSVSGRSDMPSMKGAHDSGEVAFRQNRQGDYLLPVNVVMPGGWEVLLTFSKNETVIFRGRVTFDV